MPSKIEWTDETWNPVTGCTPVSEGCKNCYAENMANRFWGDRKFSEIDFHHDRLEIPFKWKKPRRVFVCSMGDLYHRDVVPIVRRLILRTIIQSPDHTFMFLTKRPERMADDFLKNIIFHNGDGKPLLPKNLWLGVSAENQNRAEERIPELLKIPAAIRFVSIEPALSNIDFFRSKAFIGGPCGGGGESGPVEYDYSSNGIDWVIAGCESGSKRRHAKTDWFRSIRDQCQAAGVSFFLKQMEISGKVEKMPALDGKVWNQTPFHN